jgi:hypothetical protein
MASYSADDVKDGHITQMGKSLGDQFNALWQEVASIHHKWHQFVVLYGTKPSRIELLNRTAGSFFHVVQQSLWDDTLLHLARLTDKPNSGRTRDNLTVQSLPDLITDPSARAATEQAVAAALTATKFCRDHRNRRIAHRDLALALNTAAAPLEPAGKALVNNALDAVGQVLNVVQGHYMESTTLFRETISSADAEGLLYFLHDGLHAQTTRRERLRRGEITWRDFPRDL